MTPEQLMAEYEARLNEHDPGRVAELLSPDALFWFNDGSYEGIAEIEQVMQRTWETIRGERYEVEEVSWISKGSDHAVCTYHFRWKGLIDGQEQQGWGRGTSVLCRIEGSWRIIHEHLSTPR